MSRVDDHFGLFEEDAIVGVDGVRWKVINCSFSNWASVDAMPRLTAVEKSNAERNKESELFDRK
jgi:hypothetical protein